MALLNKLSDKVIKKDKSIIQSEKLTIKMKNERI